MSFPELHLHLDGSLRAATLADLAHHVEVALPDDIRFYSGMGLSAALARFEVTLACLQTPDSVKRVASEMCEDALRSGVTTLEIRFAPQLHREAPPAEIVDAALDGIDGRAGLILCGLYGETPTVLEGHVNLATGRAGVVGIDIAGGPGSADDWGLADYAAPFERARDLGIGRTVHAGEGRPVAEIRDAIELLHATRIGHGTTLLDDPSVVDLVLSRGVVIEACPTSNMQTGATPSIEAHPLPRWLELGVKATVCCDNWLLSDIDMGEELRRARAMPGMTDMMIARCIETGHGARFER